MSFCIDDNKLMEAIWTMIEDKYYLQVYSDNNKIVNFKL